MKVGNYFILNGQLIENKGGEPEPDESKIVYEVLRFIDGVPLFFAEHVERWAHSCELIGEKIGVSPSEIFQQLMLLSSSNGFAVGNVMMKLVLNNERRDLIVHQIAHKYPSDADYEKGVSLGILEGQRINPEAKVLQNTIREKANQLITNTGVYEVLLTDHEGTLSEGSRSNFFLIKRNALYTSPLYKVLKGVTLTKVLNIAIDHDIPVHFVNIDIKELDRYEAMFVTGTSPQILPVDKVAGVSFQVNHPLIEKIADSYRIMVETDVNRVKSQISNQLL